LDSEIIADTNSDGLVNGNGSGFSLINKGGTGGRLMPGAIIQPKAALPVLAVGSAK